MKVVIFAGPSLPPNARPAGPQFDWRPPVRQGELYRVALTERPAMIGVIDGYFEVTPTVWHKEILWAMSHGTHVFGAASIGALRAAELDVFGMQGIGQIYQDFRDGVLVDDDEVAVLHGPAELGYPPVTEAMVNIRTTLAVAERDDVIAASLAAELIEIAKGLFYKERSYRAILQGAAETRAADRLAKFEAWLPANRIDQKRLDALAMLDAMSARVAAGIPPLRVTYDLADTVAWQAAKRLNI